MRKVTVYYKDKAIKSFEYEWGESRTTEDYRFFIGQFLVAIIPKNKFLIIIENER